MLVECASLELYVAVLTGQCTQREAAEKWKVDRTTVATICRIAKQGALEALSARPGRPGKTAEQVELEEARAEAERPAPLVGPRHPT
jgi:transposase